MILQVYVADDRLASEIQISCIKLSNIELKMIYSTDQIDPQWHIITDYRNMQLIEVADLSIKEPLYIIDEVKSSRESNLQFINRAEIKHFLQNDLVKDSIKDFKQEGLQKLFLESGFSQEVIESIDQCKKRVEETYNTKFTRKVLIRSKELEGSFLFAHSYLTSVIGITVGQKLAWFNEEAMNNLYLAATFHDLAFRNRNNVEHELDLKNKIIKLSDKAVQDIYDHGESMAKKMKAIDIFPKEVIEIVEFHHCVYDKNSYPPEDY